VIQVVTSKKGTEKSIARTTIITLLVVRSESFAPTLDSAYIFLLVSAIATVGITLIKLAD